MCGAKQPCRPQHSAKEIQLGTDWWSFEPLPGVVRVTEIEEVRVTAFAAFA